MDFLLEIGTEELPAGETSALAGQLLSIFQKVLEQYNIQPELKSYNTPRRLAIYASELPTATEGGEELLKGPSPDAPAQAIEGFLRKHNIERSQATEQDGRLCVLKRVEPVKIEAILIEASSAALSGLKGKKLMTWGDGEYEFTRPVKWLVALLDKQVLELEYAGVKADRKTRPNRQIEAKAKGFTKYIELASAQDYLETLRAQMVEPDAEKRKTLIQSGISQIQDLTIIPNEPLLNEIIDLVEYPRVLIGEFDSRFLALPDFLIATILEQHQRYFACKDNTGALSNKFIFVANCLEESSTEVISGNQKVVTARLNDGEFFLAEDLRKPLADNLPKLENMTFQAELGTEQASMLAKVIRLKTNAGKLADLLQLSNEARAKLLQVAELAKADLASGMVFEFPELQGLVGGHIANKQGLDTEVALAISEQYQSFQGKDYSELGKLFGLLDRADNIVALFSIEKIPTGSADPFALRRQAQEITRTLYEKEYSSKLDHITNNLSLKKIISIAYDTLVNDGYLEQFLYKVHKKKFSLATYLAERQKNIIASEWASGDDLVYLDALPASTYLEYNPIQIYEQTLMFTSQLLCEDPKIQKSLKAILQSLKRIANILKDHTETSYQESSLTEQAERDLHSALQRWKGSYKHWQDAYALAEPIEQFFEGVLVNDAPHRKNLLANIRESFDQRFLRPDWRQLAQ